MTLTRALIEQIAQTLKKMPAAPPATVNITKQEGVKLLAKYIAGLQRRGYTLEQIAETIRNGGFALPTGTLKIYLSRVKAAKRLRPSAPARAPLAEGGPPPSKSKEIAAATKDTPPKGGKDAFLVNDKDNY